MNAPIASPKSSISRYHSVIILLHWTMAIAICLMLISGVIMVNVELEKFWQFNLYQWHKSVGVLLILALFARILLRAITSIPTLPKHLPKIEKIAAKLGHLALYVAMATLVLSGWSMVSSSAYGLPTVVFGWFEWPHIPWFQANQAVESVSRNVHFFGAMSLVLLLAGHIGAVIKHRIVDRENLLQRMWWQRESTRVGASPWKISIILVSATVFIAVILRITIFPPREPPLSDNASVTESDILTTTSKNYDFIVDTVHSRMTFSGSHMDSPFSGVFGQWRASLRFNPNALDRSHIHATFITDSVNTGEPVYDGTLPEADWFASEVYPEATFVSDKIVANLAIDQQTSYRVTGLLTIRDTSRPVSFDMKIRQINNTSIHFDAAFTIDRLAYRIGAESDPGADWVSRDIAVQMEIQAFRN